MVIKYVLIIFVEQTKGIMKTTTQPIGQLKTKKIVYCTICSQSLTRKSSVFVYSQDELENAKKELTLKLNKKYTCKICKSIENSI